LEAAHAEWTSAPPSILAAVAAGAALAASGAATALAQEGSVASRNRLCALAAQYGVQDLAVCGGKESGERRAAKPQGGSARGALGTLDPLFQPPPFTHAPDAHPLALSLSLPASPPSPPASTITPLPPEPEDVLRAALRDQAALGGGIASRRSGLIPLGTSTLAPAQLAALAAATEPGGGDAATGVTSGLRPTRTRKLSTNELVGLTFGLVFSATFCGGLVWLGSRKEKYGRYF
jgi:hypothetical protein